MKRLKVFFALCILLLAVPFWRISDLTIVLLPWNVVSLLAHTLWAGIFLLFPLNLVFSKIRWWMNLVILLSLAGLNWWAGPLTNQTTLEPALTHCGRTSFAGFFFPVRAILTPALKDDLEARNQICWVVKLIRRVPEHVPPEDLANHLNLMKNKLMKPEIKFRVTLPWIAFLLGRYLTSSEISNSPLLIQNLGFWSNLYTEEISTRQYAWYDYPLAAITQMEYGFIERNWENIKLEINEQ